MCAQQAGKIYSHKMKLQRTLYVVSYVLCAQIHGRQHTHRNVNCELWNNRWCRPFSAHTCHRCSHVTDTFAQYAYPFYDATNIQTNVCALYSQNAFSNTTNDAQRMPEPEHDTFRFKYIYIRWNILAPVSVR